MHATFGPQQKTYGEMKVLSPQDMGFKPNTPED